MRGGLCALLGALTCTCVVLAHPHGRARAAADAQDALLAPKVVRVRNKPDEPTCEQLKMMWRFSKRQARAPEIINDISSYRDPFVYNEWPSYPVAQLQVQPTARFRGGYNYRQGGFGGVYGRVVHKAPIGPPRMANYDEVAKLYGVLADNSDTFRLDSTRSAGGRMQHAPPPQQGRFQTLKQLIKTERAKELQAQRAAEQLAMRAAVLKDIAGGGGRHRDNKQYSEEEQRQYQETEYPSSDDPQPLRGVFPGQPQRPPQRPNNGFQFSRYSHDKEPMPAPSRRGALPQQYVPLDDYQYPDNLADLMAAYYY